MNISNMPRPRSVARGIIGPLVALIGFAGYGLRYVFGIVVVYIAISQGMKWGPALLLGTGAWIGYVVLIMPIVLNGTALITIGCTALPWTPPPLPVGSDSRPPTPVRLLISNPIAVYGLSYFGLLLAVGVLQVSVWITFIGLVSVTVLVRLAIVLVQSSAPFTIALFRSFRERVSFGLKSGLAPALAAYGSVTTINDPTWQSEATNPVNPEDVPLGEVSVVCTDEPSWQNAVRDLMSKADVILLDITEVSYWVCWEIVEACKRRSPADVILVCQPQVLMQQPGEPGLLERLGEGIAQHVDRESAQGIVKQLQIPLAYTEDLTNLVFCWKLYRRMRSLRPREPELSRGA